MAKRTINLDNLDDKNKTSDELLLEGIKKIAVEMRRRAWQGVDHAIDTNYEPREKVCRRRLDLLHNVITTLNLWPGDFDKIS